MNIKKIHQASYLFYKLAQENFEENEKDLSSLKRLAIFDFDGTLFASPERPSWWKFEGFWGRPETLNPPFVPQVPDNSWWSSEVLSEASQAISDPATFAILLTGRPKKLGNRIIELVNSQGLNFQEYHFASGGSTLDFKLRVIGNLLEKYPSISFVEMWDDRSEHTPAFEEFLNSKNIANKVHLVNRIMNEFENPLISSP